MYCCAETLTDETIQAMAEEDKICKYIDIPIQHGSDTVLKRMGRRSSRKLITDKIAAPVKGYARYLHKNDDNYGFPERLKKNFEELTDFVKELRFDKLGVFTYSPEEGTPAAEMKDQIDESVKEERKDYIMELQNYICRKVFRYERKDNKR